MPRLLKLVAASALAALVPAAPALAGPPRAGTVHVPRSPGMSLVQWGEALYGGNCISCHGAGGQGITHAPPNGGAGNVTGLGPPLRGVGAIAADFYLRTGYMPLGSPQRQPHRSQVLFSGDELRALIAYVASLGPGPPVPHPHPERGSVSAGMQLFMDHCAGCHQIVGEGGYVNGAVAPQLRNATVTQIAEAVRVGPYLMPRFTTSQISDAQLDSIIRYVRYARNPDDRGGWAIGHIGPVPEGLVTWLVAVAALIGTCLVIGKRYKP